MSEGIQQIVYPVTDLAKAKTLYSELLGVEPYADAPFYVGFRVGDQELGLDPRGHGKGMTGPVGYWNVHDIRSALKALLGAGAEVQQEVTDVGRGLLIASVKDADGNVSGLIQAPRP